MVYHCAPFRSIPQLKRNRPGVPAGCVCAATIIGEKKEKKYLLTNHSSGMIRQV